MNLTFRNGNSDLDIAMIVNYLQNDSYWAKGRSEARILAGIANSLCFSVYEDKRQIGFGRAVTDQATVFYLADIFILPEYQGRGIGKQFMRHILSHPDLNGCRGILTTQTAHSFYAEFGFESEHDIVKKRIMVLPKNNRPSEL